MSLVSLDCAKCGATIETEENASQFICKYCKSVFERDYSKGASPTPTSLLEVSLRATKRGEYGKAMQLVEKGLEIDPHHNLLLKHEKRLRERLAEFSSQDVEKEAKELHSLNRASEAEQYHLQAQFIHNELAANLKVYKSNSSFITNGNPANIDLGLQYINRSLEIDPKNATYLNLKALLLWEGKGQKDNAVKLLEKAALLNPRDINIQNNLQAAKSTSCFIATAAFGSPLAEDVEVLRAWRDARLLKSSGGRLFVALYETISPPIANFIRQREGLKGCVRALLLPIIRLLSNRYE